MRTKRNQKSLEIPTHIYFLILTQPRPDSLMALYSYYQCRSQFEFGKGSIDVTNEEAAKALKWGRDKVQKYKKRLHSLGVIEIGVRKDGEGKFQGSRINLPVSVLADGELESLVKSSGLPIRYPENNVGGFGNICSSSKEEDQIHCIKEKEVKEKEKRFLQFFNEHLTESTNFITTWNEWLDFRKKDLKAPVTERAAKLMAKLLNAQSVLVAIQIIETSMRNSWRGLFSINPGQGGSAHGTDQKQKGSKYAHKTEVLD
jgi:hypothetical protein